MVWFVAGMLLIAFSGVPGLFANRHGGGGERFACLLVLTGVGSAAAGVINTLTSGVPALLTRPWDVPGGELALRLDPLAALFILPLCLVVGAGAVYGLGYWPQRDHPGNGRRFRLFYGLLSAAMLLVLAADNGLLFLFAWEVMAVAAFFLVTTEQERAEARRAGFIYLVTAHAGALALFALFALLAQETGTLHFPATASLTSGSATLLFLLGLFGFGFKAGLMPLHIWLPIAHAAAPSHASALLSGIVLKTGIYGLLRLTSFFAVIPPWWGWTVLLLGVVSGIFGVALALAQHDLKRLLAYHSVENIGIIAIGIGLALLGRSFGMNELILLGIAGALLHVINHGLFKSLLFFSAGSVVHATGSREIDHYGGLLRRQPWTALCFLGGAVAICGLPPFNGFVSEWLIYLAAFGTIQGEGLALRMAVLAAPALALIGGLAVACFVKVFGVTFLGAPRSPAAAAVDHDAVPSMRGSMLALLLACAWIGLLPGTFAPLLQRAAATWAPTMGAASLAAPLAPLSLVGAVGWVLLGFLAVIGWWLYRRTREAPHDVSTWGCGYVAPTPRMQYTASSFADLLVSQFRFSLLTERHGGKVQGLFPAPEKFTSHTPDAVLDRALLPGFRGLARGCSWLRAYVQNGRVPTYLLYVAMTLLVLLILATR
ncbi:MAG: proton-conducting transporter transmembrane domain-containing protein [Desulfuromonadales bacterium]